MYNVYWAFHEIKVNMSERLVSTSKQYYKYLFDVTASSSNTHVKSSELYKTGTSVCSSRSKWNHDILILKLEEIVMLYTIIKALGEIQV